MKFHREFQNTNLTILEAEKYTGLHLSSALGYGGGSGFLSSSRSPGSQFKRTIEFAVPPWLCVRKDECKSKGEKKRSHKRHCNSIDKLIQALKFYVGR